MENKKITIELPCNVGDTVFYLTDCLDNIPVENILKPYKNPYIVKCKIIKFDLVCEIKNPIPELYLIHKGVYCNNTIPVTAVNKSVFLSYEDAEKKFKEIINEKNMFKKENLKTGMVVELRNSDKAMVLLGTKNGDILSGETWCSLEVYNNNLVRTELVGIENYTDIMKIYQPMSNMQYLNKNTMFSYEHMELIWERVEF